MSYTRTEWVLNAEPPINADNLNHIEDGIYDAHNAIASLNAVKYTTVTDGNWTIKKFADGTYEGTRTDSVTISVTTATGNIFRSDNQVIGLPALNTSVDYLYGNCGGTTEWITIASYNTYQYNMMSSTSGSKTRTIKWYIRGRWD